MSNQDRGDPADEPELLARLRAGDAAAFDTIYLRYYARMATFAERVAREAEPAEDIVQEVFLSLWTRRSAHGIVPPILAYLYAVVRNRAISAHRRAATSARTLEVFTGAEAEADMRGAARQDPAGQLEASEADARLRAAILALPERQQLALRLRSEDGLGTAEIARVLNISDRVVRKLLAKAAAKLSGVLDQLEG